MNPIPSFYAEPAEQIQSLQRENQAILGQARERIDQIYDSRFQAVDAKAASLQTQQRQEQQIQSRYSAAQQAQRQREAETFQEQQAVQRQRQQDVQRDFDVNMTQRRLQHEEEMRRRRQELEPSRPPSYPGRSLEPVPSAVASVPVSQLAAPLYPSSERTQRTNYSGVQPSSPYVTSPSRYPSGLGSQTTAYQPSLNAASRGDQFSATRGASGATQGASGSRRPPNPSSDGCLIQ